MQRNTKKRARRGGFTLMEMLVVLGILVLLLAMVVPRVLGTQKKADITATKSQILFLNGCLQRYALDMKGFPTSEQGLKSLVASPANANGTAASRWGGPYTESGELPTDAWGNPYQYEYPATKGRGDRPDIWSYGPDGEDNTDDDIVSWKGETAVGVDGEGLLEDDLGLEGDDPFAGDEFDLGMEPDPGFEPPSTDLDFDTNPGVESAGNF